MHLRYSKIRTINYDRHTCAQYHAKSVVNIFSSINGIGARCVIDANKMLVMTFLRIKYDIEICIGKNSSVCVVTFMHRKKKRKIICIYGNWYFMYKETINLNCKHHKQADYDNRAIERTKQKSIYTELLCRRLPLGLIIFVSILISVLISVI